MSYISENYILFIPVILELQLVSEESIYATSFLFFSLICNYKIPTIIAISKFRG